MIVLSVQEGKQHHSQVFFNPTVVNSFYPFSSQLHAVSLEIGDCRYSSRLIRASPNIANIGTVIIPKLLAKMKQAQSKARLGFVNVLVTSKTNTPRFFIWIFCLGPPASH